MAGIKALRRIQLGRESSAGTPVAATTVWRGTGTPKDNFVLKFPKEDVGYLPGTTRSYIPKKNAGILLEAVPATFEQFPHILEMGIFAATAAQDGAGTDYIYEYPFPTTAGNAIKTYTIEGGDNQEEEYLEYCFVNDFTLNGDEGEAWMMSANVEGRQATVSTFSASVPLPSVEEMLFQKSKLYIDAATAAYGTTLKSNTLLAVTLTYKTGLRAKYTAEGNLYFSFVQTLEPEVRLKLTFEHDSISAAQKVLWRAQTPQKIRIKTEGSTFGTPGTTYSVKTMLIDLAGKWESFDKIGDRNGNDILEGMFLSRWDETAADFGKITIVNDLAALP